MSSADTQLALAQYGVEKAASVVGSEAAASLEALSSRLTAVDAGLAAGKELFGQVSALVAGLQTEGSASPDAAQLALAASSLADLRDSLADLRDGSAPAWDALRDVKIRHEAAGLVLEVVGIRIENGRHLAAEASAAAQRARSPSVPSPRGQRARLHGPRETSPDAGRSELD